MYPLLKAAIKDHLRRKGLSYKELGRRIGISESGVKKLFQAKDCSLFRLQQLAEAIEVDLATLILETQETSPFEIIEIEPKVQMALQKDPLMMDIFWLLFIEDVSPIEILETYQISKSSLYRCLQQLDKLKLIVWKPGDKVTSRPKGNFLVKPRGPLIEHWIRRFSDVLINDFYAQSEAELTKKDAAFLSQRFMHLKPETAIELRERLAELLKEFDGRSTRERTLAKTKVIPVRLFAAFARGSTIKRLR